MKQFVHGNKANEVKVIPLFMDSWEKLNYISLTVGAISRTQFSRFQAIPYTIDYSIAIDNG